MIKSEKYRILVACDSFKGFFSSQEVNSLIASKIKETRSDFEVSTLALGDGGEGTLDAISRLIQCEEIELAVHDSCMNIITTKVLVHRRTGILEVAKINGIMMTPLDRFYATTTYGTGEAIHLLHKAGVRDFVLCLGGSATNDMGIGILEALGATITFNDGSIKHSTSSNFNDIVEINLNDVRAKYSDCRFTLLCDVKNIAIGKNGCTYVYASQKGARDEDLYQLDLGITHVASLLTLQSGIDSTQIAGSGAAGGIPCMFLTLFPTVIKSGIEHLLEISDFENKIKHVDCIITGEGCIDMQSSQGKFISGILEMAKKYNKDCYAIGGIVKSDFNELRMQGWKDVIGTVHEPHSQKNLQENKVKRLQDAVEKLLEKW